MRTGPVIIGYDGSPASDRAVDEAGAVLAPRPALVVVVWEPGAAYTLVPNAMIAAPIDIRAAMEVDQVAYEQAQRLAQQGAERARAAGLEAEALAVADRLSISETLVRLATERDAPVVVVGTRGHGALREVLVGSTTRGVIQHAPCPTFVIRAPERPE